MNNKAVFFIFIQMSLFWGVYCFSLMVNAESENKTKQVKGLLPEIRINSSDENENQKKSLQSEILISKSEIQAIAALNRIIQKKKGAPDEADLWYRLAELYMRRAKSGRFFDMIREDKKAIRFAPAIVKVETAAANLRKAIEIFNKIEKNFPRYQHMDNVLFNNGFSNQQLGLKQVARVHYEKLLKNHTKSYLIPDALLIMGEMNYELQLFQEALTHFKKIENYPQSKVYSYGLYKEAWTYYNLRDNENAIEKLIEVIKFHDPKKIQENQQGEGAAKKNHNLRAEALRDLSIFFGENKPANEAYSFFEKICYEEELADAMINMGKLYQAYNREKEMNIFLDEFIKKQELSPFRMKAHLLLAEANETIKNRKEVIHQLEEASRLCDKESAWAKKNSSLPIFQEAEAELSRVNIEITKKWWEIWQKNKNHKEITELTEQAFIIHLKREDPNKVDIKTRYAFSEFLFQNQNYRKASENYQIVGQKTSDTTIKHDAQYAAIVSLQKASEKEKQKDDETEMIRLGLIYLESNPKGHYVVPVKFKIGLSAYEKQKFEEAEKWLTPLAMDENSGEFKRKSEDLILDILNAKKDYQGIIKFSESLLLADKSSLSSDKKAPSKNLTRKNQLTKIIQEAEFSEIQEFSKKGEKIQAARKLYHFYLNNQSSHLAKESLWQSLTLFYASGRTLDGANASREFEKTFPDDKRSLDLLKEAAKYYIEAGNLMEGAQTFELLAKKVPLKEQQQYIEAASELYLLEGKNDLARVALEKLLTNENKALHGKIYTKILASMKGQETSENYQKIEAKIASLGHEPFASQLQLRKIQNLFDKKKYTEAFNASKAIVGGNAPDDIKASARLIQAQVLEYELVHQSTKTNIERLSLVLNMKTEKLDKAQTAYLSAAKMSKNPNVQIKAFDGLQRCYKNFVDSIKQLNLKNELSKEEKEALNNELAKLVKPIDEKRIETEKRIQELAKSSKATSSENDNLFTHLASLKMDETIKPLLRPINFEQFNLYLPTLSDTSQENYEKGLFSRAKDIEISKASLANKTSAALKKDKCELSYEENPSKEKTSSPKNSNKEFNLKELVDKANRCLSLGKFEATEVLALEMSRIDSQSGLGTYYLSMVSYLKGNIDKSLWLLENSLKKSKHHIHLKYHQGLVAAKMNDRAQANSNFIKAFEEKLPAFETKIISGVLAFAETDCSTLVEAFDHLERKDLEKFNLSTAYSECLALKGDLDKAKKIVSKNIEIYEDSGDKHKNFSSNNSEFGLFIDLLLQKARLNEFFKVDSKSALLDYEHILIHIKNNPNYSELNDWLQQKVKHLKAKEL